MIVLQDGNKFASIMLENLKKTEHSVVIDYIIGMTYSGVEKKNYLLKIIKDNPSFGPAYYDLSNMYSGLYQDKNSFKSKIKEKNILEKYINQSDNGNTYKYYINKSIPASNIDLAKSRLLKLADIDSNQSINNMVACTQHYRMRLLDVFLKVECTFKERQKSVYLDKLSSGLLKNSGDILGENVIYFDFGDIGDPLKMKIYYIDADDNIIGPIVIDIEPVIALENTIKNNINTNRKICDLEEMFEGRRAYKAWEKLFSTKTELLENYNKKVKQQISENICKKPINNFNKNDENSEHKITMCVDTRIIAVKATSDMEDFAKNAKRYKDDIEKAKYIRKMKSDNIITFIPVNAKFEVTGKSTIMGYDNDLHYYTKIKYNNETYWIINYSSAHYCD